MSVLPRRDRSVEPAVGALNLEENYSSPTTPLSAGLLLPTPETRRAQMEGLLQLLDEWLAEDPAYDRQTWAELQSGL